MRKSRVTWIAVGFILIGSLVVAILWPKNNFRPPAFTVSGTERIPYIGDGSVVRWITLCASNRNLCAMAFASGAVEIRVTNQWLKTEGKLSHTLGPGGICTEELLVPAKADTF